MFGTSSINLVDFFSIRVVGIKASELALGITEEQEEVRTVAPIDHVQDAVSRLGVHHTGKDDVLDGVKNDCPIRFGRRFTIQPSS